MSERQMSDRARRDRHANRWTRRRAAAQ